MLLKTAVKRRLTFNPELVLTGFQQRGPDKLIGTVQSRETKKLTYNKFVVCSVTYTRLARLYFFARFFCFLL